MRQRKNNLRVQLKVIVNVPQTDLCRDRERCIGISSTRREICLKRASLNDRFYIQCTVNINLFILFDMLLSALSSISVVGPGCK